jgi:hypothetical protein
MELQHHTHTHTRTTITIITTSMTTHYVRTGIGSDVTEPFFA